MELPQLETRSKKPPWYADGLSFRCTCCGNCCTGPPGYVWVTDEEITRMADHVGRDEADFRKRYVRRIGRRQSLKERRTLRGDYDCVFLKPLEGDEPEGKRVRGCGIYPVRPLQCRTWPFWDGLLETPRSWKHAKATCPGMDRGKHYTREQIEALRDAEEWPAEPPSSGE